jgi:cytochrome c1
VFYTPVSSKLMENLVLLNAAQVAVWQVWVFFLGFSPGSLLRFFLFYRGVCFEFRSIVAVSLCSVHRGREAEVVKNQ